MIVGCYSMDLYCANSAACPRKPWHMPWHQENGETASECRRLARKVGWIFRDNECWCSKECFLNRSGTAK